MTWMVGSPEETSRLTFCTSEPSSSWLILTSIPVRSLKGLRLAAMAEVGAVFSEIKLSVIPLYCFHISPEEEELWLASSPQPASPSNEAPASPAPDILKKSRRVNPPEKRIFPTPDLSSSPNFPFPLRILARSRGLVTPNKDVAPPLALDVPWTGVEQEEGRVDLPHPMASEGRRFERHGDDVGDRAGDGRRDGGEPAAPDEAGLGDRGRRPRQQHAQRLPGGPGAARSRGTLHPRRRPQKRLDGADKQ